MTQCRKPEGGILIHKMDLKIMVFWGVMACSLIERFSENVCTRYTMSHT